MQRLGSCSGSDQEVFEIGGMTLKRKRFVKLAMARGMQRNEAKRLALRMPEFGSYKVLYENSRLELAIYPAAIAIRKWGKTVKKAVEQQLKAFKEAFAGIDFSKGMDTTAAVLGYLNGNGISVASTIALQAMTKEEHETIHAVKHNNRRADGLSASMVIYDELAEYIALKEQREEADTKQMNP